jgi:WD40 repeat protein/serine/threonine protein kinase
MGTVFLARDRSLGRLVAIKLIAGHTGARAERFLVEARATAQISHENIVVIHELGEHFGRPYIVLEYLKGRTLGELLDERRARSHDESASGPKPPRAGARSADENHDQGAGAGLPPGRAVELVIPVVRALACAHERGVVHRDLKPANIMLTDTGVVKVLDFGIAKLEGSREAAGAENLTDEGAGDKDDPALTTAGARIGTAAYMSPEQWETLPVDHRTDIWAVGVILAELVLGRHPLADWRGTGGHFDARRPPAPMPSLREMRPDLGKLGLIIDRCLIERKEDRMGSARELLRELKSLSSDFRRSYATEEQNPYAGLYAFQQGDEARFFGRSRPIAEVVARLAEQPLVAIVGPSGAGKSSFVRAGVIPALARAGDAVEAFTIRPGPAPLAALAELLLTHASRTSTHDGVSTAREALVLESREDLIAKLCAEPGLLGTRLRARARRKLTRAVLFVDQLEELYTLAPETERTTFFACLAGVADDPGSPLRVILAIRSDFLDRIAEAHAAMTGLSRGLMLLAPMDREGLRKALVRPLEAVEHAFERDDLVEEMLDTLEHTSAALPLLSFTAAKLWEGRDRARRLLTEASYRRLDGVIGALAGHADAVLEAMSPEERRLARAALLRLVTPERTRAPCRLGELVELGAAPLDIERVLGRMIDARLLTVEGKSGADAMVELVHESLITGWPTLSRWLTENEEDVAFLSRLRHAAREWHASGRSDGLLWRDQAASDARRWRARYSGELAPAEERYLSAVIKRARRRRFKIVAGVTASLMTFTGTVSLQAIRADREAARAQAEALQARNATRMAAARELSADPTTVLSLLREIEPPEIPRGWAELTRWALQSGVARVVLTEPESVNRAVFSPDGSRIATASGGATARVWNADGTGEPVVLRGHQKAVWSVAWSPDGTRVVTTSEDRTARVWSADGAGEPLILGGHEYAVWSAAWSPDGARIVTSSEDATARVWTITSAHETFVLRGHDGGVAWVAWSPDGARIATAGKDATARVWRADGQGEPLVLRGHKEGLLGVAWSPDGEHIATGSYDRTARIWRADGEGEPRILCRHNDSVYSVAWSPDGTRIVTASADRTAAVHRASGLGEPLVFHGHEARLWSAAWSPDGTRIVTASQDKTARVYGVGGHRRHFVFRGHEGIVSSVGWSPDGTRIVTASSDMTAQVWGAYGSGELLVLRGHERAVWSAAWSPDGARIVTGSDDKTARLWSAEGAPGHVLRGHEAAIWAVAWSPDGDRIVTASQDKTARVWSADGAGEPVVLRGHDEAVWSAAWSPDGKRIVTASFDETARIWRADGEGEPSILHGHDEAVWSVAWSPDGERIVTASQDKTARVWRADGTGEPLALRGHDHWVNWVAWSPDGASIATASQDKTVRIWDAGGTGEPLVLRGAAQAYNRVAWSPDGKSIAAGSDDHTAWVWTDIEPLSGTSDPKLWEASAYCMPVERRIKVLNLPEATAELHWRACLRRVEETRNAAATPP